MVKLNVHMYIINFFSFWKFYEKVSWACLQVLSPIDIVTFSDYVIHQMSLQYVCEFLRPRMDLHVSM
jgi:hypothetical protein